MSRIPLLLLLSFLTLGGCSQQSGTGGGGGPGGGNVNPDPIPVFPSSGNSDQNSFDVSAAVFNPRGRNFNGTKVAITAFLADQLGNNLTIENGTPVYWATHGGSIAPLCTTTNGSCSVEWVSQNPRPAAGPAIPDPLGSADTVTSYSSGRVTILAWTLGTESFIDNNSNGFFDEGDVQTDDLPEAFLDRNGNGVRNSNEEFVNYPLSNLGTGSAQSYDAADGLYSGPNCAHPTLCAANQTVFNFLNINLAMSSDFICIVDVDLNVAGGYWETVNYPAMAPVDIKNNRDTFYFLIHDCFGNPPMSDTQVAFNSAVGELFSDDGPVGNTNVDMGIAVTGTLAPRRERYPLDSVVFGATVLEELDNDEAETGVFEIAVTNVRGTTRRIFLLVDPIN